MACVCVCVCVCEVYFSAHSGFVSSVGFRFDSIRFERKKESNSEALERFDAFPQPRLLSLLPGTRLRVEP